MILRSSHEPGPLLAHPLGGLTFRQRVVPFELDLMHYGGAPIEGPTRFEIISVQCGTTVMGENQMDPVRDAFAPAQYLELSDAEKLAAPSFVQYPSGVELRFDAWHVDELGAQEAAPLEYEIIPIEGQEDRSVRNTLIFPAAVAAKMAGSGAAAQAHARRARLRRFTPRAATIRVQDRTFAFARQ